MADITMCEDRECQNFQWCYRAQAPVNEYRQAYFMKSPRDRDTCRFYAPMEYSDGTSARLTDGCRSDHQQQNAAPDAEMTA